MTLAYKAEAWYAQAVDVLFPIAIHLHMSIVTTAADGSFNNEAILANTLDPSPYFGMDLNADTQMLRPVQCSSEASSSELRFSLMVSLAS